MANDHAAVFTQKYMEVVKLLNIYLNHFPRHEKYALAQQIRQTVYQVFDLATECRKRFYKKTSLSELKAESYVRYVDDMVIIGVDREEAVRIKNEVEKFVQTRLGLEYSHWMVSKIKRGINFVGYRTWKSVKFVRKHSMYKFRRAIKKSKIESITSLIGHAKGTATLRYYRKLLIESNILNQIPTRSQICLNM